MQILKNLPETLSLILCLDLFCYLEIILISSTLFKFQFMDFTMSHHELKAQVHSLRSDFVKSCRHDSSNMLIFKARVYWKIIAKTHVILVFV